MATSSIFADFSVQGEKNIKAFCDAIEQASSHPFIVQPVLKNGKSGHVTGEFAKRLERKYGCRTKR